jgi:hypothetical protein
VKKPRKKTRRVRMAEAIRRECDPVIFALGFRNPRKGDWNRWLTTRRNVYIRWRGTSCDEIVLRWARYGQPKFSVSFESSVVEIPPRDKHQAQRLVIGGSLRVWRLNDWIGSSSFGPWRSPESVAAFLNRRIEGLDAFFLRGERQWYLSLGYPHREPSGRVVSSEVRAWGDPWLDPESDYRAD